MNDSGKKTSRFYLKSDVGISQSPEITSTFVPRRWLRGGHVQTVASFLIQRRFHLPAPEERMVEVAPGIQVLCHCHWQADRTKPLTIIIVHGLEGSSESQYMQGVTEKALAAGMNVIRYNQRNCGGTDALAPVLYHSGLSNDVAVVARELIARDGISDLALVGFSMGGNLVLKLAGEWAEQAPAQFRAVAACCPALDLAASADALHEPANRIYETYFLWALRRRMLHKARLFPAHFDTSRLRGIRSLREFDDRVTAYYCGFTGVDDYYDRASAAHVVGQIAVPALIVHAADDPFIRITPETRRKIAANANITFRETADGGHCAFVGARNGADDGYWAESQIVNFLRGF
ncbi:MAG: alpha/beta fold hydrolase [Acidobacteriia bacterium]|nr:alpha/beta fold hydrolase [Terriglobia bacterium]